MFLYRKIRPHHRRVARRGGGAVEISAYDENSALRDRDGTTDMDTLMRVTSRLTTVT